MGKPEDEKKEGTSMVLDLSDFVKEVDRFSRLIEPFAFFFYTIDDFRRWRFRNATIVVWLLCNVACVWLSQAAVFIVVSALVIGVATLSLFQIHTRLLDKIFPNPKRVVGDVNTNSNQISEALGTVQNFRYSLIEMHDFVVKSNEYLGYFYSILKWDATLPSLIYHTEICIFLLSLVVCPARWNCFLFINWFFLCHPHVLKKAHGFVREKVLKTAPNAAQQSLKAEDQKQSDGSGKETDQFDEDFDVDDDDSSDMDMTDVVGDESMIQLDPSPTRPGMVARLMEIKKRRKQIANAPAAMKETVLVCCNCHSLLVSSGDVKSEDATESEKESLSQG